MQKLAKSLGENFPPTKIYREDIEEIYNCLREVSDEIEIEADGFKFEDLDELFSYKKIEINSLCLRIYEPNVSISFDPNYIFLDSNDNTSIQVGLHEKSNLL